MQGVCPFSPSPPRTSELVDRYLDCLEEESEEHGKTFVLVQQLGKWRVHTIEERFGPPAHHNQVFFTKYCIHDRLVRLTTGNRHALRSRWSTNVANKHTPTSAVGLDFCDLPKSG